VRRRSGGRSSGHHAHHPRDRAAGHWSNFLLHIYPVKIRRKELHFRYSWYLGVISMVLLGSLVASGVYLMFFYVPSPANAYTNIQTIQNEVPFGQYVRNVHRWSAHLMVLAVAPTWPGCSTGVRTRRRASSTG
jgi:quinol-cytochrome oxidoreductase complex cytochrome b subunit